ncbi:MAG: hypothetical protein HXL84_02700 [[Eubacterium] sulci]|nr:hypothetical protein [[Eubacterium] sulci]
MKKIKMNKGENAFFDPEIRKALDWLISIRDQDECGWAWVPLIAPNIQNTSEVICASVDLIDFLKENEKEAIIESINKWLVRPSQNAILSIDWSWALLALEKVKSCEMLCSKIGSGVIATAIDECVDWFLNNQNEDGGYPDNSEEKSGTIRTALAVWALSLEYCKYEGDADRKSKIKDTIRKSVDWLIESQHADGGWGNIRRRDADYLYQEKVNLTYADLLFQTESNPSCTGYAMIALHHCPENIETGVIKRAYKYLSNTQKQDGSWDLFLEVGIRDGRRYTFRHFSTTWALRGILVNGITTFDDESVIFGFNYLAGLQDNNFGGWRCSADADNYTWSTTNAIVTINMVRKELDTVKSNHFLAIIVEWWDLKKNEANFSFSVRNVTFAFNNAMGLVFCLVFSMQMFLLIAYGINWISSLLSESPEKVTNAVAGAYLILMSFVLGLPWVVYVKNRFNKDMESWINSIGWVYGIITGFVLAFYQLML